MKRGLKQECMHPSRCWLKQKELLISVVCEKITHVVVKFCAQKSVGMSVSRKVFFNLVKDLLNEGWSRSVSILLSSELAGIFDLGGLRKKYSCRCQSLRSKECLCAVSRKVFFNLVKDLFK